MKGDYKIVYYLLMVVLTFIILFNVMSEVKAKNRFEQKNGLCIDITEELNRNIDENSTCADYYCYYSHHAPPEGYDVTETLCVCECMKEDGTVLKNQILNIRD